MRSLNLNLVKITLLACFFIGLLIPGALGLSNIYTVPSNPGACCWASGTGSFFDNTYYISLARPETDVSTGIMFQGLNISQGDRINYAALRLYFDIEFEPGSVWATIYGYDQVTGATFYTSSSQLRSAPLTTNLVNMNLTGISSPGWVDYEVTDIVQEIINRPYWNISDNLGFIILASSGQEHRTITSNIIQPSRWPQLNITWAEAAQEYEIAQYRGYTITGTPVEPLRAFYADQGSTFDLYYLPEGSGARSQNWEHVDTGIYELGNYWEDDQEQGIIIGDTLYTVGYDTDGSRSVHLYITPLDNLTRWDKVATVGSLSGEFTDFSFGYCEANRTIVIAGVATNGLYYASVEIDPPYNKTNFALVRTGYSAGYPSGSDIIVDDYNTIWIAGGIPGPTSSLTRVYAAYSTDWGSSWTGAYQVYGASTSSFNPSLEDFYGCTVLTFYDNGGPSHRWQWMNQTDIGAGWQDQDSNLAGSLYSLGYGAKWIEKNYFDPAYEFRDVIVYTNARSGGASDTVRIGASVIALNQSSGAPYRYLSAPSYSLLANQTYYKRHNSYTTIDGQIYGIYYTLVDTKLWWANPPFASDNSFEFYNTNPTPPSNLYLAVDTAVSGIHSVMIGENTSRQLLRVYDSNGTLIDNSCIQQATTLEEIQACIDELLGGADPLDPDPPGWGDPDDPSYLTRPLMVRYVLFIGLALVIGPPIWMVKTKQWETFSVVIFLMIVGFALMLYITQI